MKLALLGLALAAIAPFSAMPPGELQAPWREVRLQNVKPVRIDIVADEGATALRVRSEAAAGSAAIRVDADSRASFSWRWKVDRVLEGADMTRKAGDDFAARVYVFFDLPAESLSFTDRMRIAVARVIYGRDVPTAAICYVWDNRNPVGTTIPNPYTDRVRMIVVESGAARAKTWVAEKRDLEQDYRQAFATAPGAPVPRVNGIAVGADTDQTGETVTAWFAGLRIDPRS